MIRIEDVGFTGRNNRRVLDGVNLTINDGDVVGIVGASGSGKSFLMRCIMSLETPTEGHIYLDDTDITAEDCDLSAIRRRIGMVFQNFNLFDHYCAVENVMAGLIHLENLTPQDAFDKAMKYLKEVGLASRAFDYPGTLSSGQKQRVAIARTIALDPEVILFDEPTSALDPMMKCEVEAVIRVLAGQRRTMVITSHEMDFIRDVCTRIVFFKDGKVWEEGTKDKILDNPDRYETKHFVRALRTLEFDIESDTFDFPGMQTSISEYTFRNGISDSIKNRLLSVTEELVQMVIIQPKEKNIMKMSFEYDRKEKRLTGEVFFSGPDLDPDDPAYFFSWPIIQMRADHIENTLISVNGFTNLVHFDMIDKNR